MSTALIRPGVTEQCTNVIGLNPKIIEPQHARVSLIKAAPGGQPHDLRLSAPQMCWSFENVIESIISTYSKHNHSSIVKNNHLNPLHVFTLSVLQIFPTQIQASACNLRHLVHKE